MRAEGGVQWAQFLRKENATARRVKIDDDRCGVSGGQQFGAAWLLRYWRCFLGGVDYEDARKGYAAYCELFLEHRRMPTVFCARRTRARKGLQF